MYVCMIDTKMALAEYVYLSQGEKKVCYCYYPIEAATTLRYLSYLAPKTPIPSNLENDQTAYP